MRPKRTGFMVLLGVLVVSLAAGPAAAAVSLDVETEYGGTAADTQAVETTLTLSPTGSTITDAELDVSETDRGFVDFDSFEVTTNPGTAEVNVTYAGDGRFVIPELRTNEEVTITFTAYPRTIKTESLDVARVEASYVQNGQNLQESQDVTADLSSSSHFVLQNERDWRLYTLVAAALFVVAAVAAGFLFFSSRDGDGDGGGSDRSSRRTR
jgi:hypothetical protein